MPRPYYKVFLLVLLTIFLITSCDLFGEEEERKPPEAVDPESMVTLTPVQERRDVLSIKLEEIRLTEKAEDREIFVGTVWMIPINADGETMRAQFQYLEEDLVPITASQPYTPGDWFLSIERENLNEQDFGIWFMVSGAGVGEPVIVDWGDTKKIFVEVLKETVPVLAGAAVTIALTGGTPGVPDEAVSATVTASASTSLMSRIALLGRQGIPFLSEVLRQSSPRIAGNLSEALLSEENLTALYESLLQQRYFSETFVIFSIENDYRVNNRISVVTNDGSLKLIFSVFETSNLPQDTIADVQEDIFPEEECNPDAPSTLISGAAAQIVTARQRVLFNIYDPLHSNNFEVVRGDTVFPKFALCDQQQQVLWWYIETLDGRSGWIAESQDVSVFMEAIQ